MGKTENINKRKREKEANWASNSHFGPTPLLHRAAQLATAPRADRWASLVSCSRNHSSLTFSLDLGPARSAISFVRVFAWVPRSPSPPPPRPCGLLVGPMPPGRRLRELGGPCRTPCAVKLGTARDPPRESRRLLLVIPQVGTLLPCHIYAKPRDRLLPPR
jgi:hypothetical protein